MARQAHREDQEPGPGGAHPTAPFEPVGAARGAIARGSSLRQWGMGEQSRRRTRGTGALELAPCLFLSRQAPGSQAHMAREVWRGDLESERLIRLSRKGQRRCEEGQVAADGVSVLSKSRRGPRPASGPIRADRGVYLLVSVLSKSRKGPRPRAVDGVGATIHVSVLSKSRKGPRPLTYIVLSIRVMLFQFSPNRGRVRDAAAAPAAPGR